MLLLVLVLVLVRVLLLVLVLVLVLVLQTTVQTVAPDRIPGDVRRLFREGLEHKEHETRPSWNQAL
jgi:hypothetical protein